MSKRIAILVSGGGTNLQALIDAQGRGELVNGRISAVISSTPDAFALERAKNAGIPGYVLPRRDFSDSRGYTAALTRLLRETVGADLVVMAGFMTILTEELFQAYPNARHQYPPLPHPLLLRSGLLWPPRPREGSGIRGKDLRCHRPLCHGGV